jgi:NTP pyrophosphatase (non-canonical NTP hydrolase)
MKNSDEYQIEAAQTLNYDGLKDPTEHQLLMLNMALGIAGEGGEIADIVKKWFFHRHELDIEHLMKELGDLQWYLAGLATLLDLLLSDVMDENIKKLRKRYTAGFSSQESIARKE